MILVKSHKRKGRIVRSHSRKVSKPSFTEFLKGKLSYPHSGYNEKGDALMNITFNHAESGTKFVHKNAKVDDYIKNRKLPHPYQVKETIYKKIKG